jgi:RNA polymerase sigma-70 factor (ECF subfamily)
MDLTSPRSADALAIESSERERVHAAVAALAPELREVIVLRELQDLSYREISEIVGIPMGTVMSRLSRARDRLAVALGGAREAS